MYSSREYRSASVEDLTNRPAFRRLRGYAFDPSLSLQLDTMDITLATFKIPWEHPLDPGPCGEYVEVVDYDPATGCWYEPVDLNDTHLLAQDGVQPSEGNPQFHQQMVYAVSMNTIANFERALGRQVQWSPTRADDPVAEGDVDSYCKTLRIYPHALRAANAFYSPTKRALLFGYFQAPTGTVFSCLSQDIVAHEITHALLDGMHRRYVEDNHLDTQAFHEAFADLVALFQHFTFPEVLKHQIQQTGGNLEAESLLGQLAQQFGQATGRYGALRNAIGERTTSDGGWTLITPDPARYAEASEPHERGSILVSAVFGAFLAIYRSRTRAIYTLSGTDPAATGRLSPELVDALAKEASKTAGHFLSMCIRALDYCPPFDITFGDYLRALITSDYDMVPDDKHGYRVALIESFRRWGVLPEGLKVLSEEQLRWPIAKLEYQDGWNALASAIGRLKSTLSEALYSQDRRTVFESLRRARAKTHNSLQRALSDSRDQPQRIHFEALTGLRIAPDSVLPKQRIKQNGLAFFEVHSVVPALRVTPDGLLLKQIIITVTQSLRQVPVDPAVPNGETFVFRGGSTLIFDMDKEEPALRYAITRPIDDMERLERIRAYRRSREAGALSLRETYFGRDADSLNAEPFCALHEGD